MAAEKPSTLLHRFASRWDELHRIRQQQVEALQKLREATDEILADHELTRVLKDTGALVYNGRAVRFNEDLANTKEPLEIITPPKIPYAFELDGEEAPANEF